MFARSEIKMEKKALTNSIPKKQMTIISFVLVLVADLQKFKIRSE